MVMNGNNHKEPVIGHDKCPYCGSEKKLIGDYVTELRDEGIIGNEAFPLSSGAYEIVFLDDKKMSRIITTEPVRPVPFMKICFDVCGEPECMRQYITRVEYGEKMVLTQQGVQQMMGNPK